MGKSDCFRLGPVNNCERTLIKFEFWKVSGNYFDIYKTAVWQGRAIMRLQKCEVVGFTTREKFTILPKIDFFVEIDAAPADG